MDNFKHFERPTTSKPGTLVSATIVSAVVGLATGVAGFSLMGRLYPSSTVVVNGGTSNPIKLNLEDPISQLAGNFLKYNAAIYLHSAAGEDPYSRLYSDASYIGAGVVVTSDGWVMMDAGPKLSDKQTLDILIDGTIYTSQELRVDKKYNLAFIKVDARNLQPVSFASNGDLALGSTLVYNIVTIGNDPFFAKTAILANDFLDTATKVSQIEFSDDRENMSVITPLYKGTNLPLFTLTGKLAGLAIGNERLLGGEVLEKAVAKMLNEAGYASLGVYYVDLSRLTDEEDGVYIYNSQRAPVVFNSAGFKAGIKSGDIVISIDGRVINKDNSLKTLLLNYKPGDEVLVKVLRADQEVELKVKF